MFSQFKNRINLLQGILLMIESFSSDINYLMKPTNEIVYELNRNTGLYNLPFISICSDLLMNGEDFPEAWSSAINSAKMPLKKSEKQKLISFGSCIGKTDPEGQKGVIKIYYDYFCDLDEKAKCEDNKYSSAAVTVCFLSGFALFILLL